MEGHARRSAATATSTSSSLSTPSFPTWAGPPRRSSKRPCKGTSWRKPNSLGLTRRKGHEQGRPLDQRAATRPAGPNPHGVNAVQAAAPAQPSPGSSLDQTVVADHLTAFDAGLRGCPRSGRTASLQEVEVEPLHQLAFRTDRIERLQQEGAEQLLGRHAGPADAAVEPLEVPVKASR